MLTYSLTEKGSDFLYIYLYKCLKRDILNGDLRAGDKLPSKRTFAKNLGISVITVENTYECLMAEGYIYSLPKKGYYVSDLSIDIKNGKEVLSQENIMLSSGDSRVKVDFSCEQTEQNLFPFSVWSRIIREELSENREALMTAPPSGGVIELRRGIAEYLKEFQGIEVMPEQIIVGAGTEYLCSLLVQLLGFDKIYATGEPGYNKIHRIYRSHKIDCRRITMDCHGVNPENLEKNNVNVLHISPSYNYPAGAVMPIGRRYEIMGWATRTDDRYIVEDGYDSEFRLSGHPFPTMQSIDVSERIIYMNTFTKTLSSTIRISYMVLPPHLINRFYSKLSFYACTVSNFEQYALARFITEGHFEKHINRIRKHYRNKKENLLEILQAADMKDKVEILEKDAGLHFLLKLKTDKCDKDIVEEALSNGIRITPLSAYYSNPPKSSDKIFVLNYSFVPEEDITPAIDVLKRIF